MSKKKWDLTSANSFTSGLEWMRKNAGAALIVAIRPQDVCYALHPDLQPLDAVTMLRDELPAMLNRLIQQRAERLEKQANSTRPSRSGQERNLDADDC